MDDCLDEFGAEYVIFLFFYKKYNVNLNAVLSEALLLPKIEAAGIQQPCS